MSAARQGRPGYWWSVASLALAASASLAIALALPLQATLLLLLAWPIVVTIVPLVLRGHERVWIYRTVAASLLFPLLPFGYGVLGGLFVPSIAAMLVAAFR